MNNMDPELKHLLRILIEGQTRTGKSVNELAVTITRYVDAADARMRQNNTDPDT